MTEINSAQRDVLEALLDGPKTTSNRTKGTVVSGGAAFALERRGFVAIKARHRSGVFVERTVKITPEGRKLIRSIR